MAIIQRFISAFFVVSGEDRSIRKAIVINSVPNGRLQARKVLVAQMVVLVASVLVLFWSVDQTHALAAALGGGGLVVGTALAAWMALGGKVPVPAGVALGRLLAGMVLKWLALITVLLLAIAVWHLPPIGLAVGVVVALLAQVVTALRHN